MSTIQLNQYDVVMWFSSADTSVLAVSMLTITKI